MALITCPECGKQISDKAPACPNCGYPISPGKPETLEQAITPQAQQKEPEAPEFSPTAQEPHASSPSPAPSEPTTQETKSRTRKILLAAVAAVAVVAVIIGVVVVQTRDPQEGPKVAPSTAQQGTPSAKQEDSSVNLYSDYNGASSSGSGTKSDKEDDDASAGLDQRKKQHLLDRSESELMDSIEYDLAGQLIYDNVFSVQKIPGSDGNSLHAILVDTRHTGTGFSFLPDSQTGQKLPTLIAVDYTKEDDAKALAIGAAALFLEGDTTGQFTTIRDAYQAFSDMLDSATGSTCTKTIGSVKYTLAVEGTLVLLTARKA